ncbi:phosphatase PAP2 family protein [Actinacidiphila sp. bgisy167]|uniref:phosphatase PAP2 family protein n=1 Tax=Actinacidiphila sp. bgisy167 TaxID=3413797 RepID=UPI003D758316
MTVKAILRETDRRIAYRVAAWDPPCARCAMPAVGRAARHGKVWCFSAALMAGLGGRRGRTAAWAGLSAVGVAQVAAGVAVKPLTDRPRPPPRWVPRDIGERPGSSSFPSGHTAAAVAFAAAVGRTWPTMGAACALPAAMVALERVHSGSHYPSDVAAGAVIGLAAARLVHGLPPLRTPPSTGGRGAARTACCLSGLNPGRRAMSA